MISLGLGLGIYRNDGGASSFSPLDLNLDGFWDPDQSYSGTLTDVTGLPDLTDNGRDLTYHTALELAIISASNGKSWAELIGGGGNNHFYNNAVGALVAAGANVPWTHFGVVQLDAINTNPVLMTLCNTDVADNYQIFRFPIDGSITVENKNTAGTVVTATLSGKQAALTTKSFVLRINGDGTLSFWLDGILVDAALPFSGPTFASPMTRYNIGANVFSANGNAANEANGKFGAHGFAASALSDTACADIAEWLLAWHP